MKNKAAVALASRRWKGKTKAEKSAHMRMMALKKWAALKGAKKTSKTT